MMKFNLSYETLWKTPTTLCKGPWQVCLLLIIFSASGFPVIIKFQPVTCILQSAKHTCRFRGENLTVLCYFCSGFLHDKTPDRWKNQVRCNFFFLLEKNMSLLSVKYAFIWWYFCIIPRLRRLVQGFWKWDTVVSPHAFVIDRSRGPCGEPDFKLCLLFLWQAMEKQRDFLKKHCRLCVKNLNRNGRDHGKEWFEAVLSEKVHVNIAANDTSDVHTSWNVVCSVQSKVISYIAG